MNTQPRNNPPDYGPAHPSGIHLPPGTLVPRVAMPAGPMRLANGIVLRYDGPRELRLPATLGGAPTDTPLRVSVWSGPHNLRILGSLDHTPHGDLLHLSLSYPTQDPTWEILALVKDAFYGDIDAAIILPRAVDYANVHRHCFHLWQVPVAWGIE